jgi:3-hydroxyisobutyrate dehydrogenase
MGAGMARSALRAGHEVTVWNRTAVKAAPLAADGATVADSVADALAGADVALIMVYDADSVLDVLAAASGDELPVFLQTSTVGIGGMRRIADVVAERSLRLLDSPVVGTRKPAEDGKLVVLASGDPALRRIADPVFEAIGSRTVWVGDELGQASALKLVANAWVASLTAAAGQSLALASTLGVDPKLFLETIGGGPSDTPYLHLKGNAMLERDYTVSFGLANLMKDVRLMIEAGDAGGMDTGLLSRLLETYDASARAGYGEDDIAAVYEAFRPAASGSAGSDPASD